MKKIKELFKNPFFYIFISLAIIITFLVSSSITTKSIATKNVKKEVTEQQNSNKNLNTSNNKNENNKPIAKCNVSLKICEFPPGRKYANSVVAKVYNLIDEPISAEVKFVVLDKDNRVISSDGDSEDLWFNYIPPKGYAEKESWLETSNYGRIEGEDLKKVKIQIIEFKANKVK